MLFSAPALVPLPLDGEGEGVSTASGELCSKHPMAFLLPHAQWSFLEENAVCDRQGSAMRAGRAAPEAEGQAADLTCSDPTAWCGSLPGTSWSRAECTFCAQILNMACAAVRDGKSIFLKYLIKRACAEEAGSWAKEGVVNRKMPILHFQKV